MMLGHDTLTSDRTQDIKIAENVSFDSMLLSPKILNGLKASGFYVPSPIQLNGIPMGKCGFDLILEAKSGTGKTAVFVIIALEKLNLNKGLQTLMLAPTREIASQICDVIKTIGANFQGLTVEVVMGGLPFEEDVEKFKKKVHIVVGSPGRLSHLISQKHIDVSTVRLMVLDEADKLFEKCFLKDIKKIYSLLPSLKQMIMSSATYPENIKFEMKNYLLNAHHICPDSNSVLVGIEHIVSVVPSHVNIVKQTKIKYAELIKILSKIKFKQCLVFCNYQVRVGEVHKMLNNDDWPADKLYGKQQQTDRLEALKILQEYRCRILVSTDLAARGIDASNIDLVVNFEIPFDWQTYLHRTGRAGRFGSYGSAITILCEDEQNKFRNRLRSVDMPFNFKHLWNKEPFLLERPETVEESHHEEENDSLPEVLESVIELGIKEMSYDTSEELCIDYTRQNKEINDIQTFESLCESFEQANRDTKIDSIESFSDLCSSFHSHEIKINENSKDIPVEDSKLIIPCSMFNGNIILQSFQKLKSATLTNKYIVGNNDKMKEQDVENYDTNDDKQSSNNKEETCTSKYNNKTHGNKHCQSETVQYDVSLPSTSKSLEYKTSTKSKANRETKSNESLCPLANAEMPTRKVVPATKTNDRKSFGESDYIVHKSDSDHTTAFISPEYDDSKRALLAANLPTAFGKSKLNRIQSTTTKDLNRKKHFNCNSENIRNNEHQVTPKTVFTIDSVKQQADSVYESFNSDINENKSVSQSHQSIKDNIQHHKINKKVLVKSYVKQKSDSVYESSDSDEIENVEDKSFKNNIFHHKINKSLLTKSNVQQKTDSVNESSVSDNTEDESVSDSLNPFKYRKSYKDIHPKTNKTVLTKSNVKQTADFAYYEKTESESASPYASQKGKKSSKSHSLHTKTTKKHVSSNHGESNHYNDYRYHVRSSAVVERQRQFDRWYQELQTNMRVLERLIYIEEIKRLNKLY